MPKRVIIIGAGGHAKVIADIVIKSGDFLIGFLDDNIACNTTVLGYPVLGRIADIKQFDTEFVLGIGDNYTRKMLSEKYVVGWYTAIHPSAVIALDVTIGEGTVIVANAVINPSATIHRHCIVNSGAIVEHDTILDDYVHLSPNAALGGAVTIGACTQVGIGAAVKNNVTIASGCLIGAGAVVVKDIIVKGTYVGVPAKILYC